ncbi:MAG: C39 family peptidase [Thiotrichales bacterium]
MTMFTRSKSVLAALLTGALLMPALAAGYVPLVDGATDIGVKSLGESKFDGVTKQQLDYSCGSAALSTLLTFHYETPVDEGQVFKSMYGQGDQEKIKVLGFSMQDMKSFVATLGFDAEGFKMPMASIEKAGVPGIVLLDTNGYRHFVVVKGIDDHFVLLGDPALGLRAITKTEFESQWTGIFFLIRNQASVARYHFNKSDEWGVLASAPYQSGVERAGLSDFTLSLPARGDF